MEQCTLVKWLKILVLFAAVCGLGLAGGVLPLAGQWLVESYPEFSYCFWPWLIFLWVCRFLAFGLCIWRGRYLEILKRIMHLLRKMQSTWDVFPFWQ